jgi:hypothetical protein
LQVRRHDAPGRRAPGKSGPGIGLSALLCAILGCGGPSGDSIDLDLPPITAGTADDLFENTGAESITFRSGREITLVAGETTRIQVDVQPPGQHEVRFALLGQAGDAFLSRSIVPTDAAGMAETDLTVLAAASSFAVRAAAGRVDTMLRIVTLPTSEGNLIVTPDYSGSRSIARWVASVHVDQTCAGLQGVPFPDGSAALETSSVVPLRLERIKAGSPLAVVIRAEQFAGGCRSLDSLSANSDTFIDIDVMDRPMQTANLALRMSFSVEATAELNPALEYLAFRAASSLTGTAADDLAALLDAMSSLAEDPPAFEQARNARGWRTELVNNLAPGLPGSGLRTMVQSWMQTGLAQLNEEGALAGTLTVLGSDGAASLVLESVIGLAPQSAGFEPESIASAYAETEDFLRVGATLDWKPSPFLAEAATLVALAEDPARSSVADAMATRFGCPDVAALITGVGEQPGQAFAGCGEACILALCQGAMVQLWSRVEEFDLPAVPWQISAAARAQIDENARPVFFEGDWVGSLTVTDFGSAPIQGPFSGSED